MNLKDTLATIISEEILLPGDDIFLVEVILTEKSKLRLIVIMDGDNGVSIDRCAYISRKLGAIIEERNLIEDAYLLEVSSPGLDHPLKLKRQYTSNIGRRIKVELNDGSLRTGKLEAVGEEKITVLVEPENAGKSKKQPAREVPVSPEEIPFNDIKKTNVLVSFT